MSKKEIPVFKPGTISKFFYYLSEFFGIFFSILFVIATGIWVVMYIWALIHSGSVPIKLFGSDGVWSWSYQLQSICCFLFFWLFSYQLKKALMDIFSKKETITIKIDYKKINHTGHTIGMKTFVIGEKNNYFEVTEKAYDKLNIGNKVIIQYTKGQRNVRMITLLR
jgi:hypothetical protein